MSEKIPTNKDNDLEARFIRKLKAKGPEDVEVLRLTQEWTEREEEKVANNPLAAIEFNRKVARVYLAAGYRDETLDRLEGARTQAWNEQRIELYEEIVAEINKIESD